VFVDGLKAAVESGQLAIADIDAALRRTFAMRVKLGMFDAAVPLRDSRLYGRAALDTEYARGLSLQAAEEAIVLLKNDAQLLPLAVGGGSGKSIRIGVMGPVANDHWVLMGGKEDYCPFEFSTPLLGLQAAARSSSNGARFEVVVDAGVAQMSLGRSPPPPPPPPPSEAAAFAKSVDVVILCLGGKFGLEGQDDNATLPADQLRLAQAVLGANSRTAVVMVAGNPMSYDWLARNADTLVHAGEGGQSAGTALANMLLGLSPRSPSGVLPWTVYPDNYTRGLPMDDMAMRAGEGRTYRFYRGRPTFPFAFGLTYASFGLEWAEAPPTARTVAEMERGIAFRVAVRNTGPRAGAKVVAVFVSYHGPTVADGPRTQLLGLAKVLLLPGASAVAVVESNAVPGHCSFCSVSEAGQSAVRPGRYTVTVGDAVRSDLTTHISVS